MKKLMVYWVAFRKDIKRFATVLMMWVNFVGLIQLLQLASWEFVIYGLNLVFFVTYYKRYFYEGKPAKVKDLKDTAFQ